jgi:hypothetical protein
MFMRFVIHKNDEDSGRRQGLFQAMSELRDVGTLDSHEQERYEEIYDWFRKHLKKPRSFTRSSKPHAKNVALSWFRDDATEHISRMREIVGILDAHDIAVDVLHTTRPGYVVYEDKYQVAAEPFSETVT